MTEAALPRLSSEEHLRELSPGSATRPRWVSSSSASRLPWDSSHGRDTRGGSPRSAADGERTQRALDAATATTVQRKLRLQQVQQDIAEAESAEKKPVAAAATAREAIFRSTQAAAIKASATPSTPTRQQGGISLSEQSGDSAFFEGSVLDMAAEQREELAADLGKAVVTTASALLKLVRQKSMRQAESLSVGIAWSGMDHSTWQGQKTAIPTLTLVKALPRAHDDAQGTNVLWSSPEDAQLELRRQKNERRDRGKIYRRGGGGSGGGSGGGNGKGGGDGSHGGGSNSHHRCGGDGGKDGGGGSHGEGSSSQHRRGGGSGNGGGGDTSRSGAGGGAPGRRSGGGCGRPNRGNGGRSSGGGQGGRRDGARGCPQESSSSSSSSNVGSSADQGEVKVLAGERQTTPSLMDIAFSAERLSKVTVTDDRAKPYSSDLAHARTSTISTAAASATAKAALDDSVKCVFFSSLLFSHTSTFQHLDKPWSQVSSLLPPGSCLQFLSRIGFSNPTARRFFVECC